MVQLTLINIEKEPQQKCNGVDIVTIIKPITHSLHETLRLLSTDEKIEAINQIKLALHEISPMKKEPVDCVLWVKNTDIQANDYNPNSVAPPEMELLKTSILNDGYTQPIVSFKEEFKYTVVDGFHRNRVGKECDEVRTRVYGYLPITIINSDRADRNDRIASTIRHNRARGKHQVESMSDIVIELKKRNWSDARISKELGMDEDEILRLCQVSGLTEVFSNTEFSQAWEAEIYKDEEFKLLTESDIDDTKKVTTKRIFHTWDKWECYKAGFYNEQPPAGYTPEQAEQCYKEFLSDLPLFEQYLNRVITEWKFSCEHYLSNENMNRIAWLGQASMCLYKGIPAKFRGGYNLLSDEQKKNADLLALKYLNIWLSKNGFDELKSLDEANSKTEPNLY